jgi:CRP-like cAMP-binding protein
VAGTPSDDASTFLDRLEPAARRALDQLGTVRRRRKGAMVLVEGDRSDAVLVVLEGRVKVLSTTAEGRDLILALRGPGESLGELTAVAGGDEPRSASVVAIDDVEVRVIPGDAFRRFLVDHPSASLELLRTLVGRLRAADRQRIEYGSLDVPHRLARLLVELAGRDDGGVPLSQEELAGLVSASRETLARALGSLRARGLVATGRRSIAVLDLERLRAYAAG